MSEWLDGAISQAKQINDWLSPKRLESLEKLSLVSWPTRKTEAWKYTPLRAVERSVAASIAPVDSLVPDAIMGLDSIDIVLVNGHYSESLSTQDLPEGLFITLGSHADLKQQKAALSLFSEIKPDRHLFGLVNDVLAEDVVLVSVAEGVSVDKPIRVTSLLSDGAESHTRVQVSVAKNASLVVIESTQAQKDTLSNFFIEYDIGVNASLEHYRFALQTGSNLSLGGCHFSLSEKAKLNSTIVAFGSDLSRLDTDIIHSGEYAEAKLNAIYLLDGKELFDLHANVEHAVPNCTTEENVRGIVADYSRAVFNGRIHIHRDAQKTLAELNNRNLLMSDKAEINTKPELEIYADDVRCAHGATIAEIDKQALYYLQTRGVSRAKAQIMLNFGFINELIDLMPNEALAEWIRPIIRERFAQMEVK